MKRSHRRLPAPAWVVVLALCWTTLVPALPAPAPQATGDITFVELFHVTSEDVIQFFRDTPSLKAHIDNGTIAKLTGKPRSLMVTADAETTQRIVSLIRKYENLEVRTRVRMETIPVKYASVQLILETLSATNFCQVWHRTEETKTDQTKQGNKTITYTYKRAVYAKYDAAKGDVGLATMIPEIPYVMEIPHVDPIDIPPVNMGQGYGTEELSLDFPLPPSTETRNRILVVGTPENIEQIRDYIDEIDRPAKQIMVECQIIELNASNLTDLGIDLIAIEKRHNVLDFATPQPGEAIPQPSDAFSAVTQAGLSFLFDDQAERMSGKFLAQVHALVRNGDAVIRARPKLYTLDDRQNLIHIGDEVPTFVSTQVNRDIQGGNFVEEVNQVAKQYVGITLNVKPRISSHEMNEISMLVDIQINILTGRQRVFDEDLLGVPTIAVRKFRGQARIKNHRPLILGGMIREEENENRTKIPVLGDLPWVGDFLGRTSVTKERREIIIVLTPHILSEQGIDPISTPKESIHFDTFNSVLFNDRYIMKGRDLVGLDPISRSPVEDYTEEEVIDLTLLHIVKKRELVRKLRIFDEYLPESQIALSIFKRRYPEKSVRFWSPEEQKHYYRAGAIVVENIKSLNPDLTYEELVSPRREIVIPTSPYHVSLSYEKLKHFYNRGQEVLERSGSTTLSDATIEAITALSGRTLREFGDFMEMARRDASAHGQLHTELVRHFESLFPNEPSVAGLPYPEFFRKLGDMGIDFLNVATYLRNRLETQFRTTPMKLGSFEGDLGLFTNRTISLDELAERLQRLDERWQDLNTSTERPVKGL